MPRGQELSEVLTTFLPSFEKQHTINGHRQKVITAITTCRTAVQGGHLDACDSCGTVRISYNSCRNRHCPKCGGMKKEQWVEARHTELLPVHYYHLVFTVPEELNSWIRYNERQLYDVLFAAAWQTVQTFAQDQKYLGAETAMIAILHTWGQTLNYHPHVHCIVPGGGFTKERKWRNSKRSSGNFLFPVRAMANVYRATFLQKLKQLKLQEPPAASKLEASIQKLYNKLWVVHAKRPFGGPQQVVEYLGRYTHKVAISNQRLIKIEHGRVHFHYKDYRDHKNKQISLAGEEFIRRWLQHILPHRFVKIRHYGFLANRDKNKKLRQIAVQLGHRLPPPLLSLDYKVRLKLLIGIDLDQCPHCKQGKMILVKTWHPIRSP